MVGNVTIYSVWKGQRLFLILTNIAKSQILLTKFYNKVRKIYDFAPPRAKNEVKPFWVLHMNIYRLLPTVLFFDSQTFSIQLTQDSFSLHSYFLIQPTQQDFSLRCYFQFSSHSKTFPYAAIFNLAHAARLFLALLFSIQLTQQDFSLRCYFQFSSRIKIFPCATIF